MPVLSSDRAERDLAPGRRLLLIAGALALALCGVSALVSWQAYDRQREVVARETAALARAAASNAGRFVTDRLALLEAVASAPPVVATDAAAMDRYFRLVNRGQRFSGGIGFVDRSGRVRAHSRIDDLRRRVVRAGDRDPAQALPRTELAPEHRAEPDSRYDVDDRTTLAWLDAIGAPALLHGHTHRPARHALAGGRERIVLADWELDHGTPRGDIVRWTAGGFERRSVVQTAEA